VVDVISLPFREQGTASTGKRDHRLATADKQWQSEPHGADAEVPDDPRRRRDLGGRGQWRVEVSELEAYIQRQYAQTDRLTRQGATHAGVDPRVDPGEDPTPKN
jgi:hypothetical protein